jgi:hypothetical protein
MRKEAWMSDNKEKDVVYKIIVPFASDGVTHPEDTEIEIIHYANGYIVTSIGVMNFETYDRVVRGTYNYNLTI